MNTVQTYLRIVEVPNRFWCRLLAVLGAVLHPFSTTIIRIKETPPCSNT